jgi:dTDP-glucose 4,6-dehydratase
VKILISGGSGFIGSNFIKYILSNTSFSVINIDKLTYASNTYLCDAAIDKKRYFFFNEDICNYDAISKIFHEMKPNLVVHFAAETHVDNSITSSDIFLKTNILGTHNLLEVTRNYLISSTNLNFLFHHISTDEVFGELIDTNSEPFNEMSRYNPSSPYAVSKASSDHLVRAWGRTYNIPYLISNCSNNFGPHQNSEKLIPKTISNAIFHKPIPVYGDGKNIRDWIFVDDHIKAILELHSSNLKGATYLVGGQNELTNLQVIEMVLDKLETIYPIKSKSYESYKDLITFTEDRKGHDYRYAINCQKIINETSWKPSTSFADGIEKTIIWYLKSNQVFV